VNDIQIIMALPILGLLKAVPFLAQAAIPLGKVYVAKKSYDYVKTIGIPLLIGGAALGTLYVLNMD
jgi:hypothetical protein